jgi:hypothetical protein
MGRYKTIASRNVLRDGRRLRIDGAGWKFLIQKVEAVESGRVEEQVGEWER